MIEFPVINKILIISIDFIAIWLAVLVFNRDRKSVHNRLFLWMVPFMLGWVNFAYLARLMGLERMDLSSTFLRIAWFVTPPVFFILYLFVVYLIKQQKKFFYLNFLVIVSGIISSLIVGFGEYIIRGVSFVDGYLTILYGPWMLVFLLNITFIIIATVYVFIYGYLKADKKHRRQLEYVGAGISIFYVANLIFNIYLPIQLGIARFYYLGDYSLVALLALIAYAVIKESLLGVRVFLTQLLMVMVIALLFYDLFLATSTFEYAWKGIMIIAFVIISRSLNNSVRREIQYREKLEVANKKLKQLDNAKTEFLSIASHQLRTPLSGIKGYLSMMIEGDFGKFSKEQQDVLIRVYKEVERLIRLVQVFLNVSRIESGRLKIDKIQGDLRDLVDTVIKEMLPAATEKGLELEYNRPNKPLLISADFDKLKDVVVNLVDNAIKYTKLGDIQVKTYKKVNKVYIEVKDTGVGIDQAEVNNLFSKFTRAKGIAQVDASGSGLGLFIAKKIIEGHNGRIWAESQGLGKGSIFKIELPLN